MNSPRSPSASTVGVAQGTEQSPSDSASESPALLTPADQKRQQWSTPSIQKVGSVAEATLQSVT
jgi:hypothetical protein